MSLLRLQGVHKTLGGKHLLRGVELSIEPGERIGLLGRNGEGKSTLLAIAAGTLAADEGERITKRGLRLGVLEQEPKLPADTRVRDAVAAGFAGRQEILARLAELGDLLATPCASPAETDRLLAEHARLDDQLEARGGHAVEHRVDRLLRRLRIDKPDALCSQLSGGERRRVALARLLLDEPELLLLDEPTNHLDALTTDWLEDELLAAKTSLLLVTHDRYLLDRVAERTAELDRGQLHMNEGGYGDWLLASAERDARERKENNTRRTLLRRETAWMQRGPPARSTKARARIARWEALVDGAPEERGGELDFQLPSGPRLGQKVLELHGVTLARGGKPLFADVDFEMHAGMRLGIAGPNGAGKSSFLDVCLQRLQPDAGRVVHGDTVKLAAIDQARTQLDPQKSVLEEVGGTGTMVNLGGHTARVETFLEQFLFPGPSKFTLVDRLSGGERQRVLLAKLLCQDGNLLVLDEPTNDLDLATLRALEEALVNFPGAVLVVSHDRYFLDRVSTHVMLLDGSGNSHIDTGDLSSVIERRKAVERKTGESGHAGGGSRGGTSTNASRKAKSGRSGGGSDATPGRVASPARAGDATGASASSATPATSPSKRLSNYELKELDELPDRIDALEQQLAQLDERLADPALYAGPTAKRDKVLAERESVAEKHTQAQGRWEELESRA
ncbi:MAG: energy-dependent translational throttle protein EttA [Planctomycetota bacterium]|nr:MAG: energy-dependent translational throttle protein EttA [Planctomycetota bacterium]